MISNDPATIMSNMAMPDKNASSSPTFPTHAAQTGLALLIDDPIILFG
jgi:hypothetical protein